MSRFIGPIWAQLFGLKMRRLEGGFFFSFSTGRIGRGAKFPPQFGQTPPSFFSTQSRQNVHSKVQIIASVAEGGKSLSQHSQLGRNSSICSTRIQDAVPSSMRKHNLSSPAAPQLRAVSIFEFGETILDWQATGCEAQKAGPKDHGW
jgi:hypothetical protein